MHHDPHELRRLAVKAHVDPRTIARVLEGRLTKSATGARVRAVLEAEGIEAPSFDFCEPPRAA